MDIPDILKIVILKDFLKIAKKRAPQGPYSNAEIVNMALPPGSLGSERRPRICICLCSMLKRTYATSLLTMAPQASYHI